MTYSPLEHTRAAVRRAAIGHTERVDIDADARPLLADLINERTLDRAIVLLEREGSSRCRLSVAPRRSAGSLSLTELFEADHQRLDSLAVEMCEAATRRHARSVELARAFAEGLRRHIRIEEEVLFPVYEAGAGEPARAITKVMRREHRAMERYLADVVWAAERLRTAAVRTASSEAFLRSQGGLAAVMADHNVKEERALFPIIDRMITPMEREGMLRKVILF